MVTVLKSEGGAGTQILSANVRRTIQSIKEIVRDHSDSEIYNTLRESNMDPNETAQKLLNQDPFHEVKRKRDKKKENAGFRGILEPRRQTEDINNQIKFNPTDQNARDGRKGVYTRNNAPVRTETGISREFRVVRDNRVNQNSDKDSLSAPASSNHPPITKDSGKSTLGPSSSNKHSTDGYMPQKLIRMAGPQPKITRQFNANGPEEHNVEKKLPVPTAFQLKNVKANNFQSQPSRPASSGSAVGVYESALDPVHVPSPESRSPSVGAIKRQVGVVGLRKQSFQPSSSNSNLVHGSATGGSFRTGTTGQKSDVPGNSALSEIVMQNMGRAFGHHHGSRQHQQPFGHQKGALPSKEWKPKTSLKLDVSNPGVIGAPLKSASILDNSKNQQTDVPELEEKLTQLHVHETQNVIIAQHIRVPDDDRCRLTFGSFGKQLASLENSCMVPQTVGNIESTGTYTSDSGSSKLDDQVRNSGSTTPPDVASEQLDDKKVSPDINNVNGYVDLTMVSENGPSSETQQQKDFQDVPNFSAYPQSGYDITYFRPSIDDAVQCRNMPSQQEALASHSANSIPASSIAMLPQQPQQMTQMYQQQVHVSHFANLMPYRQFLSPVYMPPVGLPGYSTNPAAPYSHPHPSGGSGYVFVPGASSHHLAPNGQVKYGVQQFKPVPGGSAPTVFGAYGSTPTGFAISAPSGVVGGGMGLEDSSRIKYKDSNLYVPNPQGETSEVWIQNPREIPGMQSAPYYGMQGQTAHAAAYMPSHAAGHSFSPSQSSQMQFAGVYHAPPQHAPLVGPMGANIGVGVSPAGAGVPQVGAYQQQPPPQLGQLNWTGNY